MSEVMLKKLFQAKLSIFTVLEPWRSNNSHEVKSDSTLQVELYMGYRLFVVFSALL